MSGGRRHTRHRNPLVSPKAGTTHAINPNSRPASAYCGKQVSSAGKHHSFTRTGEVTCAWCISVIEHEESKELPTESEAASGG